MSTGAKTKEMFSWISIQLFPQAISKEGGAFCYGFFKQGEQE